MAAMRGISAVEGRLIACRVPLEVDGVFSRKRDTVFGDIDGVVMVPREVGVIREALERSLKERKAKQVLRMGVWPKMFFRTMASSKILC